MMNITKKKAPISSDCGCSHKANLTLRLLFSRFSRLEILALSGVFYAGVMAVSFSLRFYLPSWGTIEFIWRHYLGALVPALIIIWLIALLTKRQRLGFMPHLGTSCRQIIAFLVVLYLHFNFKLWAQLINPRLLDELYQSIDNYLIPIIECAFRVSFWANQFIPADMNAYHELFVAMFALSYLAHSLTGQWRQLESILLATGIVLLLGSMSYAIAPAIGPFINGFGHGITETVQRDMLAFHRDFIDSGGVRYDETKFVAALAAMPSLHVANAFVVTYYSLRYVPLLGPPFILLTLFFAFEAVTLRWHYLVDVPFGLLLAGLAIWIAESRSSEKKVIIESV